MAARNKSPIVIMNYSDLVYFLDKNDLFDYKDKLDKFLKSKKVQKAANEIVDDILGASLHINEAESVEYFSIAAQALVNAKKQHVGIKNPTFITSSSNEAK